MESAGRRLRAVAYTVVANLLVGVSVVSDAAGGDGDARARPIDVAERAPVGRREDSSAVSLAAARSDCRRNCPARRRRISSSRQTVVALRRPSASGNRYRVASPSAGHWVWKVAGLALMRRPACDRRARAADP